MTKKINEAYGKTTLKALGTLTGITKDYTGQNVSKSKRFRDNALDFAQTVAASSAVMGNLGPKSLIIPASITIGKAIGVRRAIKQHENLMKAATKNKQERSPEMSTSEKAIAEAVESILNKNYDEANNLLEEAAQEILLAKMFEMKKITAARLAEQIVQPDGMVLMATGERVLPSIARHRRGLSEAATSIFGEPTDAEKFGPQHTKGEEDLGTLEDRRLKELEFANKGIHPVTRKNTSRGPETIIDYKKRKDDYFKKAAGASILKHPNDPEAAAKHMHGLVTSVENEHEPWMATHKEYDNINKQIFKDLVNDAMRRRKEAGTPEGKKKAEDLAAAKEKGARVRAMNKEADKRAWTAYLAKKGKPQSSTEPMTKARSEKLTGEPSPY